MDEWFDVYSLTHPSKREELQVEGLRDSINFIRRSIIEEADIVTTDRVIMLGLSQGSATGRCCLEARVLVTISYADSEHRTGLFTLLASQMKIGAYIGLNGWIPFKTQIQKATLPGWRPEDLAEFFNTTLALEISRTTDDAQSFLKTPVFLGHTIDDEVIDFELGQQTRTVLEKMGMKVTWKEHQEGGHLGLLDTKGLDDVVAFLGEVTGQR